MTNAKKNKNPVFVPILPAILLAITTLVGSILSYRAGTNAILIPIHTTQTAEARLTPTPFLMNDSEALTIESIPQNVFVFAGNDNPDGGHGLFLLVYDEKHVPVYRMDYSLPADKYGYAGMVFQFIDGTNLSGFKAIAFTIIFEHPGDKIELFIKDIAQGEGKILFVGNTDGEMNLSFEFSNFGNINFNAVKEIGVIASTDYAKGDYKVKLLNVRLLK